MKIPHLLVTTAILASCLFVLFGSGNHPLGIPETDLSKELSIATPLASTGLPQGGKDSLPAPVKDKQYAVLDTSLEDPAKETSEEIPVTQTQGNGALQKGETAFAWIDRMQREYGVYAYPGTQFFVAPATPCTFQADILGCTEQWMNTDGTPTHTRIRMHLTEASIGNIYVLFHEIGHTYGIMDECQADIYSRKITGIPGGFYC